eukprot:TRINITY_DN57563_c0_g1_i1.p1 TRINITY_DN57563_c0_g1~~TRINITY_DN57563_c0_g1_i1.p1  ORF type:complete len:327 (-),score=31.25 TRINITY_DN57563_c0_g1_i1:91-1071(-)
MASVDFDVPDDPRGVLHGEWQLRCRSISETMESERLACIHDNEVLGEILSSLRGLRRALVPSTTSEHVSSDDETNSESFEDSPNGNYHDVSVPYGSAKPHPTDSEILSTMNAVVAGLRSVAMTHHFRSWAPLRLLLDGARTDIYTANLRQVCVIEGTLPSKHQCRPEAAAAAGECLVALKEVAVAAAVLDELVEDKNALVYATEGALSEASASAEALVAAMRTATNKHGGGRTAAIRGTRPLGWAGWGLERLGALAGWSHGACPREEGLEERTDAETDGWRSDDDGRVMPFDEDATGRGVMDAVGRGVSVAARVREQAATDPPFRG